jgi:hypothetical protein
MVISPRIRNLVLLLIINGSIFILLAASNCLCLFSFSDITKALGQDIPGPDRLSFVSLTFIILLLGSVAGLFIYSKRYSAGVSLTYIFTTTGIILTTVAWFSIFPDIPSISGATTTFVSVLITGLTTISSGLAPLFFVRKSMKNTD